MLNRTALYEFCERVKLLNEVDAWMQSFDNEVQDEIWQLIAIEQLDKKGIDETGKVIGYYSRKTEQLDSRKKAGSHYTMNDTGDFINSIVAEVSADLFTINADGQKPFVNLFDKYGDGIIGLTSDNLENLKILLTEKFIQYARRILQLD